MLFPRKAEVLEIHRQLLEQFGGPPGLRGDRLFRLQPLQGLQGYIGQANHLFEISRL